MPYDYLLHNKDRVYRLDGVMVTVLVSGGEDRDFDPLLGQAKDYKKCVKTRIFKIKDKVCLNRSHDNVSE
jgi:hypothetical protein